MADEAQTEEKPAEAEEMVGEDGKALSQDEIDNLLGFSGAPPEEAKTGIEAMLDKALLSYERLPMLEVVFDRFVRMLSTSLRNFTSDNVDVDIHSITSLRFGDYVNSIPMPAILFNTTWLTLPTGYAGIAALNAAFAIPTLAKWRRPSNAATALWISVAISLFCKTAASIIL